MGNTTVEAQPRARSPLNIHCEKAPCECGCIHDLRGAALRRSHAAPTQTSLDVLPAFPSSSTSLPVAASDQDFTPAPTPGDGQGPLSLTAESAWGWYDDAALESDSEEADLSHGHQFTALAAADRRESFKAELASANPPDEILVESLSTQALWHLTAGKQSLEKSLHKSHAGRGELEEDPLGVDEAPTCFALGPLWPPKPLRVCACPSCVIAVPSVSSRCHVCVCVFVCMWRSVPS